MVTVRQTDMVPTLPGLAVRRKPSLQIQKVSWGRQDTLQREGGGFQQGLEADWDGLGAECSSSSSSAASQMVGRKLAKGRGQNQPVGEKRRPACPEGEGVGQT